MTMTLASAKKLFANIVTGKEENNKANIDKLFKFASDSKTPLTSLLSKANLQKAIELGIIQPPNLPKKPAPATDEGKEKGKGKGREKAEEQKPEKGKGKTQKAEEQETSKQKAEKIAELKKAQAEKIAEHKAKFTALQDVIKANTTAKPSILCRLAWKEGRKVVGMDVLYIHPVSRKTTNLIGIMLEYDGDNKTFRQLDLIGCVDVSQLEFDGRRPVIYDDTGKPLDLGIFLPKPKEEKAEEQKPKARTPKKPKAEKEKAEGKKEGE